jgi:hypothetical protein
MKGHTGRKYIKLISIHPARPTGEWRKFHNVGISSLIDPTLECYEDVGDTNLLFPGK